MFSLSLGPRCKLNSSQCKFHPGLVCACEFHGAWGSVASQGVGGGPPRVQGLGVLRRAVASSVADPSDVSTVSRRTLLKGTEVQGGGLAMRGSMSMRPWEVNRTTALLSSADATESLYLFQSCVLIWKCLIRKIVWSKLEKGCEP